MKRFKLLSLIFVSVTLASSCAVVPDAKQVLSLDSTKQKSSTTVKIATSKKKTLEYDVLLANRSNSTCMAPDAIVITDSKGYVIPLLSPSDYVAVVAGESSAEAMMRAQSASYQAQSINSSMPTYTYAQTYGAWHGDTYRGTITSNTYQSGGFAGGFASGFASSMASGSATRARKISAAAREKGMEALKPTVLPPGARTSGKIWSTIGDTPMTFNIYMCGDHHQLSFTNK
jgi:hypothetical protein